MTPEVAARVQRARMGYHGHWKREAAKKTGKALVAGRVLEIYGTGGGYREVMDEFGSANIRHPQTGKSLGNSDDLIAWAIDWYLSEPSRNRGAARLLATVERLAYNETTLPDLFEPFELAPAVAAQGDQPARPAEMSYRLKPFDAMTPDERASIQEITVTPAGKVTVKARDRSRYLSLLTTIFTARPNSDEAEDGPPMDAERRAKVDELRARMMAMLAEMAKPVAGPAGALAAGASGPARGGER